MAGFRTFVTAEVLTAANVNDFLMKQSVMVFANDAARTSALGAEVSEGMISYNLAEQRIEFYDGAEWKGIAAASAFNDLFFLMGA